MACVTACPSGVHYGDLLMPFRARAEKTRQYREELANPFVAASRGYLDDVILPEDSRVRLIAALESLRDKRQPTPARKHGNIPL